MKKTDLNFYSWIEYSKGIACYEVVNNEGYVIHEGSKKIIRGATGQGIYLEENRLYKFKDEVYVVEKELFSARGQGYRLKLHDDTVYNLITGEEVK